MGVPGFQTHLVDGSLLDSGLVCQRGENYSWGWKERFIRQSEGLRLAPRLQKSKRKLVKLHKCVWRANKRIDKSGLMSRLGKVANARTQHLQWMAGATRSSWLCWEDTRHQLTPSMGESEATYVRLTSRHWLIALLSMHGQQTPLLPCNPLLNSHTENIPVKNKGKLTRAMASEINHKHSRSRCPWVLGRGSLFMSCFSERLYAIECAHLRNMCWSLGPWYGAAQTGEHEKVGPRGKQLIHGFTSFRKDYCISRENLVHSHKNLPGLWTSWLSQLSHKCVLCCPHRSLSIYKVRYHMGM